MKKLDEILLDITKCDACGLMSKNTDLGIRYVPILPKPRAKVVFIGRDPSPRTASIVGIRGGRSVFIKEIFKLVDNAGLTEEQIYITDLLKCHWRTSVGTPLSGTEDRPSKLDIEKARICMDRWLSRELAILNPELIVAFGEELYKLLRERITKPSPAPHKLSASRDKKYPDGESWFVSNGPMELDLKGIKVPLAILRHPGNSTKLKRDSGDDLRLKYHRQATKRVTDLLKKI